MSGKWQNLQMQKHFSFLAASITVEQKHYQSVVKDTIKEIAGTQIIEWSDYFEKTTKITLAMFPSFK